MPAKHMCGAWYVYRRIMLNLFRYLSRNPQMMKLVPQATLASYNIDKCMGMHVHQVEISGYRRLYRHSYPRDQTSFAPTSLFALGLKALLQGLE